MLNISEEQKKLIESQGYMVVEFKLWCKKLLERLQEAVQRAVDGLQAVVLFLEEMAFRAFDRFKELADRISKELKPYIEYFKPEYEFEYETRRKYHFVRSIGRKYQPNFSHRAIYHRCRDRC